MYWDGIVAGIGGWVDAFEKAGMLRELADTLDNINSTLAVAEGYGPPPVIVRTLVHDGLRMLDGFAMEYRGYVGKMMDHAYMELRSLLYEVLGGE
jgi:hypothetical protein